MLPAAWGELKIPVCFLYPRFQEPSLMSNDSTQQSPAQKQPPSRAREEQNIGVFTVEFADDWCRNFTITTPPLAGLDIRGRWDTARMARRQWPGDRRRVGMRDFGTDGNKIPSPIPGLMLAVDVRRKKVRLFDPLVESKEGKAILDDYNEIIKSIPALKQGDSKIVGIEAVEYDLTDDQMKTLLLELLRKKDSKCIDMIEGDLPTAKQIEQLDGDELYDPSNVSDDKPYYKKDLQAFKDRQRAAGV